MATLPYLAPICRLLPVLLLAGLVIARSRPQAGDAVGGRLRHINVVVSDVFRPDRVDESPLLGLFNRLHWESDEAVVRREIWLRPGDAVSAEQAAELERNLRALKLFAEVTVRLLPVGDGRHVDLEVVTRDRLSLSFSVAASHVGGVTNYRGDIGEGNLFGLGDRVGLSFVKNSEGEYRGSFAYRNLHLFDTWHTAGLRLGETEDGSSLGVDFRRPFKHLADPRAYGLGFDRDELGIDYHAAGEVQAEVPVTATRVGGDVSWADGPERHRRFLGLAFAFDDRDYAAARGPLAAAIRVPGSTTSLDLAVQARWTRIDGYRKVVGIDTLDYVQDLTLGWFFGGSLGGRWRDEQGRDGQLQPRLTGHVRWVGEPAADCFVDLTASGAARWQDGATVGWRAQLGGWSFVRTGERNAIVANLVYDTADEDQDLPVELTLGEDNGLRGYPAYEFAGSARARLNVENRFNTGIDIATLRLGAVVFGDAGWVGSGSHLGRPYRAAGVGLRLGSRALLGDGVLRLDLARPFDAPIGVDDGWQLSVSLGQVIHFGDNARAASSR